MTTNTLSSAATVAFPAEEPLASGLVDSRDVKTAVQHAHRFVTLDMLRGVASLAVVCAHTGRFFGGNIFDHGYLAVDFFFMLSGFVLMSAYANRLASGWSLWTFLKVRVVRLYPLYLLGALLGISFSLVRSRLGHVAPSQTGNALPILFALVMLPLVVGPPIDQGALYPYNGPTWSLFYELLINVVHGLFLRRPTVKMLLALAAIAGCLLAIISLRFADLNVGFIRSQIPLGIVRVAFSYFMGMALFLLWKERKSKAYLSSPVSAAILLVLLWIPTAQHFRAYYDLVVIVFLFPPLLFASASAVPSRWAQGPALLLGQVSYAVYVLHVPIANWVEQLWLRIRSHRIEVDAPWSGIVLLLVLIVTAVALEKFYDLPARARLRRWLSV